MASANAKKIYEEVDKEEYEALLTAYKREKEAREKAELVLETRATFLFKTNQRLLEQYVNTSKRNQEFDYLLKITKLETIEDNNAQLINKFLEYSSMLVWAEASFCFYCDETIQSLQPVTNFIINVDSNDLDNFDEKFRTENFEFLNILYNEEKTVKYSNFLKDMRMINTKYAQLNFSYMFPLRIDKNEKYMIWFTFPKPTELSQETIELIQSGLSQLKTILEKNKSRTLLLENYKRLKEVKSQLIQSEKMASIGTISAGIAHEINNPLSFLLTNSEVLKGYLESIIDYISELEKCANKSDEVKAKEKNIEYILSDTPQLMNESLEGIARIREIVQGLRTFSRADDGEIKDFDINNCLETSLKLVSNELKHKCKIEKHFEEVPLLHGSAGQLIQVFTNLLVNSAQAIEDFGAIEVCTSHYDGNVVISIADNGKGISKENLNNLFTPFFTTKPTGQGTGLGLSISYGIIKRHHGNISVESEVGKGTKFSIFLPVER